MILLKSLARNLLGKTLGLSLFGGGFWLLFTSFVDSNIPLGLLGGTMMLLGMWVMALTRRG